MSVLCKPSEGKLLSQGVTLVDKPQDDSIADSGVRVMDDQAVGEHVRGSINVLNLFHSSLAPCC